MSKICDFKNRALAQLKGNWMQPVLLVFISGLIIGGVSPFAPISLLLTLPIGFGVAIALLGFYRGEKDNLLPKMFDPFNDYSRMLTTALLVYVYTMLWTLLFIIPGIIKGLSYTMTPYVLKDNPELSNNAAIDRSMAIMEGKKWKLFVLYLSFIGWFFLGIISFGIGFFWISPYLQLTVIAFYEEAKEEYEAKQAAA